MAPSASACRLERPPATGDRRRGRLWDRIAEPALAAERPDAHVVGVDPDHAVLALARRKPGAAQVTWIDGFAQSFSLPTPGVDVVVCSLLLHHLRDADKATTLAHVAETLADGGALHVADWGPPRGLGSALGARALKVLDGSAGPQSLLDGQLPNMLTTAGFTAPRRRAALRTAWGTLELWRAQRPGLSRAPVSRPLAA